jgi:hypothetical protein
MTAFTSTETRLGREFKPYLVRFVPNSEVQLFIFYELNKVKPHQPIQKFEALELPGVKGVWVCITK